MSHLGEGAGRPPLGKDNLRKKTGAAGPSPCHVPEAPSLLRVVSGLWAEKRRVGPMLPWTAFAFSDLHTLSFPGAPPANGKAQSECQGHLRDSRNVQNWRTRF